MEIFNDKKKNVAIANPHTPEISFGAWMVLSIEYISLYIFPPFIIRMDAKCGTAKAKCGGTKAKCGGTKAKCGGAKAKCGGAKVKCGGAKANCGGAKVKCGTAKANCGGTKANCGTAKARRKSSMNFTQILNNKKFN
jgi:hypothetical protein